MYQNGRSGSIGRGLMDISIPTVSLSDGLDRSGSRRYSGERRNLWSGMKGNKMPSFISRFSILMVVSSR